LAKLRVSEKAAEILYEALRRSDIVNGVIVLVRMSPPMPANPDVIRAMDAGNLELAKEIERRAPQSSIGGKVAALVVSGSKYPDEVLLRTDGFTLALPAQLIQIIEGWTLEVGLGGLELVDAEAVSTHYSMRSKALARRA
jgi:hypothetical protein